LGEEQYRGGMPTSQLLFQSHSQYPLVLRRVGDGLRPMTGKQKRRYDGIAPKEKKKGPKPKKRKGEKTTSRALTGGMGRELKRKSVKLREGEGGVLPKKLV